jgi:hypothetical protein
MTVYSDVCDSGWSVSAVPHEAAGGFDCTIQFRYSTPQGIRKHAFTHSSVFPTEREAILAGLREGMFWVDRKMSEILSV